MAGGPDGAAVSPSRKRKMAQEPIGPMPLPSGPIPLPSGPIPLPGPIPLSSGPIPLSSGPIPLPSGRIPLSSAPAVPRGLRKAVQPSLREVALYARCVPRLRREDFLVSPLVDASRSLQDVFDTPAGKDALSRIEEHLQHLHSLGLCSGASFAPVFVDAEGDRLSVRRGCIAGGPRHVAPWVVAPGRSERERQQQPEELKEDEEELEGSGRTEVVMFRPAEPVCHLLSASNSFTLVLRLRNLACGLDTDTAEAAVQELLLQQVAAAGDGGMPGPFDGSAASVKFYLSLYRLVRLCHLTRKATGVRPVLGVISAPGNELHNAVLSIIKAATLHQNARCAYPVYFSFRGCDSQLPRLALPVHLLFAKPELFDAEALIKYLLLLAGFAARAGFCGAVKPLQWCGVACSRKFNWEVYSIVHELTVRECVLFSRPAVMIFDDIAPFVVRDTALKRLNSIVACVRDIAPCIQLIVGSNSDDLFSLHPFRSGREHCVVCFGLGQPWRDLAFVMQGVCFGKRCLWMRDAEWARSQAGAGSQVTVPGLLRLCAESFVTRTPLLPQLASVRTSLMVLALACSAFGSPLSIAPSWRAFALSSLPWDLRGVCVLTARHRFGADFEHNFGVCLDDTVVRWWVSTVLGSTGVVRDTGAKVWARLSGLGLLDGVPSGAMCRQYLAVISLVSLFHGKDVSDSWTKTADELVCVNTRQFVFDLLLSITAQHPGRHLLQYHLEHCSCLVDADTFSSCRSLEQLVWGRGVTGCALCVEVDRSVPRPSDSLAAARVGMCVLDGTLFSSIEELFGFIKSVCGDPTQFSIAIVCMEPDSESVSDLVSRLSTVPWIGFPTMGEKLVVSLSAVVVTVDIHDFLRVLA